VRSLANSLVLGLLLLVGVFVVLRRDTAPPPPSCADDPSNPECVEREVPAGEGQRPDGAIVPEASTTGTPSLRASEICPSAGYLCDGLGERGISRVMRWPDTMEEIEVRVPRPDFLDATGARELQAAAVRGILAWQGSPFPVRITRSERPGSEDFAVSWSRHLNETELGRTGTRWERRGGVNGMEVTEFVLTTHVPGSSARLLDPRQVQLTAAHEMGHALGLPHSDDDRDLMYPTNTATRLTTRDYLVMEALYGLENGAEILDDRY